MEVNIDWLNASVFCIIPVLSVAVIFFCKRNFLWTAPLLSTALSVIICVTAFPSILSDCEHRAMFFGIAVPMYIAVAMILTVIAYIVTFLLKRKR